MSSMTVIKLSGPLIREFGRTHHRQLESGTANEAFSALRNTLPGFKDAILRLERQGMRFAIFRNRKNVGPDELGMGGCREIRVVPVIAGSKRAGLLQTVVGIAMVVAATVAAGPGGFAAAGGVVGGIGTAGIALTLGGVVQMLSPRPRGFRCPGRRRTCRHTPSAVQGTPPPAGTRCRSASGSAAGAGRLSRLRSTPRTRCNNQP